jgi:hypothetical protein
MKKVGCEDISLPGSLGSVCFSGVLGGGRKVGSLKWKVGKSRKFEVESRNG